MFFEKEIMNKYIRFRLFILVVYLCVGIEFAEAGRIALEKSESSSEKNSKKNSYYFPYIDGYFLGEYKLGFMDGKNKNLYEGERRTQGYFDLRTVFEINFSDYFSINNAYRIKPVTVRNYDGNYENNDFYAKEGFLKKDMYFDKYDLIAEEIYLNFFTTDFQLGIGKFNSVYGLAYNYDRYNGIWGDYFTDEYSVNEVVGGFLKINLPFFVFNFSSFLRDTSFLSNSLFERRGVMKDGTLAGTSRNMNNFAVSGEFIINDSKLNLAFRRMAAGNSLQKAEKSYLIGLEKVYEYVSGVVFTPFLEYNYTKNYEGILGRKIHYFTANAPFIYERWNFLVGGSSKYDKDDYMEQRKMSYLLQAGVGYKFDTGIMIDIGRIIGKEYRNIETSDKKVKGDLTSWSFRLSYITDFHEK